MIAELCGKVHKPPMYEINASIVVCCFAKHTLLHVHQYSTLMYHKTYISQSDPYITRRKCLYHVYV